MPCLPLLAAVSCCGCAGVDQVQALSHATAALSHCQARGKRVRPAGDACYNSFAQPQQHRVVEQAGHMAASAAQCVELLQGWL